MATLLRSSEVLIYQLGTTPASEVMILAHGAWHKEDKTTLVPAGANLHFYVSHKQFTITRHVNALIEGRGKPVENVPQNSSVYDYRLSYNDHYTQATLAFIERERGKGSHTCDTIMMLNRADDSYVLLSQCFAAVQNLGIRYTTYHYLACRVQWSKSKGGWK